MALTDKSSIVIPKGFYGKANVLQGFNPQTENLVDLDVVRNTTATRVNEQGLIESVPANVPRRDFLNGGCGELLVEPQRTNYIDKSEDTSAWTYTEFGTGSAGTITTGYPDMFGGNNAVKIDFPADADNVSIKFGTNILSSAISPTTASLYIKLLQGEPDKIIRFRSGSDTVNLNVSGSEFVRYSGTFNRSLDDAFNLKLRPAAGTSSGGFSIIVCHPQEEEGSYPTSYIPTTTAAVTRNQDVISATNIGSLLNDAEGGVYLHGAYFDLANNPRISIGDNTLSNYVALGIQSNGQFFGNLIKGGVQQTDIRSGAYTNNDFVKQAIRYAPNNYAYYANGTQIGTDNTVDTFANNTLNNLKLDIQSDTLPFFGRIRELIVFNNAPTDSELQTLTTP